MPVRDRPQAAQTRLRDLDPIWRAQLPDTVETIAFSIQLRGGSGFQVLKQLRASSNRPEAVIVVTNHPSDDYRIASRECGADHFFDKASEFHKVREVLLQIDAA